MLTKSLILAMLAAGMYAQWPPLDKPFLAKRPAGTIVSGGRNDSGVVGALDIPLKGVATEVFEVAAPSGMPLLEITTDPKPGEGWNSFDWEAVLTSRGHFLFRVDGKEYKITGEHLIELIKADAAKEKK